MRLNDFFDEIYCINLEEREDRWLEVQKEFEKIEKYCMKIIVRDNVGRDFGSYRCGIMALEDIETYEKARLLFNYSLLLFTTNKDYWP